MSGSCKPISGCCAMAPHLCAKPQCVRNSGTLVAVGYTNVSLEPVDDIGTLELEVACDPALVSLLASVRDTRLLFDAAQDRARRQMRTAGDE